jgi:hypothetical protein
MDAQLHLLASPGGDERPDTPSDPAGTPAAWRLDERTREIGRQGVARARQALADARRQRLDEAA